MDLTISIIKKNVNKKKKGFILYLKLCFCFSGNTENIAQCKMKIIVEIAY